MVDNCVTIMHLTDLHLQVGDNFGQTVVLDAFHKDLQKLADLDLKPDLLLFSGDLAKVADEPDAYYHVLELLLRIGSSLNLDQENILICPGNHDVSRAVVGPSLPQVTKWQDIAKDRDEANKLQTDASYANHVFKTFSEFRSLAEAFGQSSRVKAGQSYAVHFFRELGLAVVVINTATLSTAGLVDSQSDERRLVVPERLLVEAFAGVPNGAHVVVMGHHPLTWLNESNEDIVRKLLESKANMYVSGHLHAVRPQTIQGLLGKCHFSQSGALYEWRDHWSGYAIYRLVPRSPHIKATYRRWYEDRREFSKAEDISDDGVVYSDPDAEKFFQTLNLKVNVTFLEDWRKVHLEPFVAEETDKTLSPVPIGDSFVAPEFDRVVNKSKDSLDLAIKREVLTFEEAAASKFNFVISASSHSGKTTTIRQWAKRLAATPASQASWTAPVIIDFSETRDYASYFESLITKKLPSIPAKIGSAKTLLRQGLLTLFVDDVDFQNIAKLKVLAGFMESYPTCRFILVSTSPLFEAASVEPIISDALPFTHITLRPLRRRQLLSLIEGHKVVDSAHAADQLLERVTREARSLNVPLNAVTGSFLIQIFGAEPDRILVNQATLIERYVELLLQKFTTPDVELRSFDFKLKRDLLAVVGADMLNKGNYEPHYNDVLQIVIDYVKYYGFPQDASSIVKHLITCRILEKVEREDGSHLRFPLAAFLHYFVACRMITDKNFRLKIFDSSNYLSFASEISFYAALVRNDEELLDSMFDSYRALASEMWINASQEVKDGTFLDTFVEPGSEATEDEIFAIHEVIKSNEETDSARLVHMDTQVESRSAQNIERPVYSLVDDKWLASLLLVSSLLKHMELVSSEKKRLLVRELITGWIQFCTYSLGLIPQIVKDKSITLHGVRYKLSFSPDDPMGEIARKLAINMPLATSYLATSNIGSEKLRLQLSEGIGDLGYGAGEQLFRAMLLADIGVPGISGILRKAFTGVRKHRYLSKVLSRKLYDVAIRFRLEKEEVNEIRNLAGDLVVELEGEKKGGSKRREAIIAQLRTQRLVIDRDR